MVQEMCAGVKVLRHTERALALPRTECRVSPRRSSRDGGCRGWSCSTARRGDASRPCSTDSPGSAKDGPLPRHRRSTREAGGVPSCGACQSEVVLCPVPRVLRHRAEPRHRLTGAAAEADSAASGACRCAYRTASEVSRKKSSAPGGSQRIGSSEPYCEVSSSR